MAALFLKTQLMSKWLNVSGRELLVLAASIVTTLPLPPMALLWDMFGACTPLLWRPERALIALDHTPRCWEWRNMPKSIQTAPSLAVSAAKDFHRRPGWQHMCLVALLGASSNRRRLHLLEMLGLSRWLPMPSSLTTSKDRSTETEMMTNTKLLRNSLLKISCIRWWSSSGFVAQLKL
jgi:hypothetical protein